MSLNRPLSPRARRCTNGSAVARPDLDTRPIVFLRRGVRPHLGECQDCGYVGPLRKLPAGVTSVPRSLYPHLSYRQKATP